MDLTTFLENFREIAEAPGKITKLKSHPRSGSTREISALEASR
jgi:hypothetical protein